MGKWAMRVSTLIVEKRGKSRQAFIKTSPKRAVVNLMVFKGYRYLEPEF
jgi:hypothetical protein